jgi:hypothetical protein
MEDFMNTLVNVLSIIGVSLCILYVTAEAFAAIYIYRNRRTLVPMFGAKLRSLLGISNDALRNVNQYESTMERLSRLERKVNFIGNHTVFERKQLRKLGILKDEAPAPTNLRQINPS